MKKAAFLISAVFLVLGLPIFADEINIFVCEAYHFNALDMFTETEFTIRYDTESEKYYLKSSDYMTTSWIHLDENQLEKISNVIEKYKEWEAIAIENQTTLDKVIPDSLINTRVTWVWADDWYHADFRMAFKFFSQNENRHQLIIVPDKVTAESNQFVDLEVTTFYLESDQANALLAGIQPEKMADVIAEWEAEQVNNQNLFN